MSIFTGKKITAINIRNWKRNNHVNSGYVSRFQKGYTNCNKGKKFPGKINSGCFKKGHVPANRIEIGKEMVHAGYPVIKIQDNKANRNFVFKARFVWEKANGPIPPGKKVIHLDGDRMNCDISNLELIDDGEIAVVNCHLGLSSDPELNRTIINTGRLMIKAAKKGKNDDNT